MAEAVTEVEHVYGGDVGENPVTIPEPVKHVVAQAGLATADAVPGQAEAEGTDGGVD